MTRKPKQKKLIIGVILMFLFTIAIPIYGYSPLGIRSDSQNCKACSSYSLGYIPLEDDNEFIQKIITLPSPAGTLPTTFDWRNYKDGDWTTPIRDQGSCGSCWAFGAIGALEAAINIEYNDSTVDIDLSEQYLVSCGPGHGCEGGWAQRSFQWMINTGGALPESCFPYEASDLPCDQKCADWESLLLPVKDYWTAEYPSDEEIKQALIDYGPLVADTAVYDDWYRYRGGVYVHPQTPDESENDINHQPVIIGYNDDEQCWIIKNSWGKYWGENTYGISEEKGYIRIRYGDCFIGTAVHGVVSDVIRGNDTGRPVINLTYPQEGWLYIFNNPIKQVLFGRTKVIGSLSVEIEANDIYVEEEDITGIDYVEFYLDGVSQYTTSESPYVWNLERNIGFHEIKIIAFDGAGNPSNTITLDILKIL
jgi:C1A family cysteine protease